MKNRTTNRGMLLLLVAGTMLVLGAQEGCSINVPIGSQDADGSPSTGGSAGANGGSKGEAGTILPDAAAEAGGSNASTGGNLGRGGANLGGAGSTGGGLSTDAGSDALMGTGGRGAAGSGGSGGADAGGGAAGAVGGGAGLDAGLPMETGPRLDGGANDYAGAYLAWQAPGGTAGTGRAVVVSGAGWMDTWERVSGFSPEQPPSSATHVYTMTPSQIHDLFARLAATDVSALPHAAGWAECYGRLYWRLCPSCAPTTLNYNRDSQLAPEMESVWSWFDEALPSESAVSNPRSYCPF